jgi:hypothetical protein
MGEDRNPESRSGESRSGESRSGEDGETAADSGKILAGCRFIFVTAMALFVMFILATILWLRIRNVDPVRRCANAYNSSYTAIDTTLVDRINVRTPDGAGRTTCAELRHGGLIDRLPPEQKRRPFER